jgi:hypothetical protein
MSILSRLFRRPLASPTERLEAGLGRITPHLSTHWVGVLSGLRRQLTDAVSPADRYRVLREFESLYGGMGSLNDDCLSTAGDRARDELFAAIQEALREVWRALGREHHAESFRLWPVGSAVRLIPGTTRYLHRDGSPWVVVAESPEARHVWRVEQHAGRDITNMPLYTITHDSRYELARHEALAAG